jgi:hypothetical protein
MMHMHHVRLQVDLPWLRSVHVASAFVPSEAPCRFATAPGAARLIQQASPSLLPPTPLVGLICVVETWNERGQIGARQSEFSC